MKRVYITTIVAALLVLAIIAAAYYGRGGEAGRQALKVGFIYDTDESTPYTYNFSLAERAVEKSFPGQVEVYVSRNVPEGETLEPVHELVRAGCHIIFTNNYSGQFLEAARLYPDVQFCQTSYNAGVHEGCPDNYHTFNATIYQGRYITGLAAGLKLRDMIDNGLLAPDEVLVGYVGAFPSVEIVSGYTAFLMGVRSVAPEAVMRVRYTGSWSSYSKDKAAAKALIDEGCVVIAQHVDTIGPAMACEEAAGTKRVYHVAYNQSMMDISPSASLIGCRANWVPYVMGAVEAMLDGKPIERSVKGSIHGNDISAGLDQGWVEVTELNQQLAAYGTQEKLNKAIEGMKKGNIEVFKGDYTGVNLNDESDTIDLSLGYKENETTSWPTFGYLLRDVITVEE